MLFANACKTPAPIIPVARVIEKERIITKSYDAVWQSAVEWFATHNTPIKNLDKGSGIITTEYSLSMGEAYRYMDCGGGNSTFSGKVELANYSGNFNLLIKKISDNSTKVSVNVFYSCSQNKYKYKSVLSSEYVLESSNRVTCSSKGQLEKDVFDYIEANN